MDLRPNKPIVEVTWMDHWEDPGFYTSDEIVDEMAPWPMKTVGYLVADSDEGIVVSFTFRKDHKWDTIFYILKANITNIRYLSGSAKRKANQDEPEKS